MRHCRFPRTRAEVGLLSLLAVGLFISACGGGGSSTPPTQPLSITTQSLPEGSLGQSYQFALGAAGGSPPVSWSLASSSDPLPPGLGLDSVGNINGVPSANGSFNFTVQVRDSRGSVAARSLAMRVRDPLVIQPATLPMAVENREWTFTFTANGGLPPYTWASQGGLPTGLVLDTSGTVSGRPTSSGHFTVYIRVQDRAERIAASGHSLDVVGALKVITGSLDDTNVGYSYGVYIWPEGGLYPLQWRLAPGSNPLPPGLNLSTTGWTARIEGVATQPGNFNFVLEAADSLNPPQVATRELSLVVGNKLFLASGPLPLGVVGRAYQASPTVYGGTPPYTWRIVSGALPAGLTFDPSTGEFAGTPQQPVEYVLFGVEVKDSSDPVQSASGNIALNINPPVDFDPTPLYDAIRAESYAGQPVTARWGKPPYSLRTVSGALPPGLSLSSSSSDWGWFPITGTAATLGQYRITFEVSDSSSPPTTASREFSIRVVTRLDLITNTLADGWVGEPYLSQLNAGGGVAPYTWHALFLDPGLSLDESTGLISGTPQYVPAYSTQFQVQDASYPPQIAVKYFLLPIAERLVISSKIPPGRPDIPYQVKLGLKGGKAPYIWALTSGSLPQGLAFDPASWLIQGTPTAEGVSNFTVQVTDTGPPIQTVSKALSLTIASDLGRNDSPATATPISNGTFRASISPYADPVAGPVNPDHDYYQLTAAPGAIVTVDTTARRLSPESFLDTVLEIVDSGGNRLSTCLSSSGYFDGPCLNDDIELGIVQDSRLEFRVPESASEPLTFYLRVFSWDGSARPDYVYDLTVSGAN